MRIGFDAKRAFFNRSGLGNYSRDTISVLSEYYPMNEYYLFSPKPEKSVLFHKSDNIHVVGPQKFWHKKFPSFWRSYKIAEQLASSKIEIYHGLSNELPFNIDKINIPTVVTVHDLIFMRYPEFYKAVDRRIYKNKILYAANSATRIIAVSKQTSDDLVRYFNIPESKIDVVYQGCNPIFWGKESANKKAEVCLNYLIPERFMLYVGTIEERKNLLNIVKAIHKSKIDFPLVVVGKATAYLNRVKAYIENYKLRNIYILQNVPNEDLPALYQMAELFIYPSVFEGFGIPILEALTSKVPVITTSGGCFSEAGGKSSIYIDPMNADDIASAISLVLKDARLRDKMIAEGYAHAINFRQDNIAQNLIKVYEKIY